MFSNDLFRDLARLCEQELQAEDPVPVDSPDHLEWIYRSPRVQVYVLRVSGATWELEFRVDGSYEEPSTPLRPFERAGALYALKSWCARQYGRKVVANLYAEDGKQKKRRRFFTKHFGFVPSTNPAYDLELCL